MRRASQCSRRGFSSIRVGPCSVVGSIAGGVGAVIGVGGGVIASPILRVLGMDGKHASASCLPMVLSSAAVQEKQKRFFLLFFLVFCKVGAVSWHLNTADGVGPDLPGALLIGLSAVAFSPLGVKLSVVLPSKRISQAMGALLAAVGVVSAITLLGQSLQKEKTNLTEIPPPKVGLTDTNERVAGMIALGCVAGLMGGAFGIGGGVLIVPVLVRLRMVSFFLD